MEKTFEYKEQESGIFGQVRRPIITVDAFFDNGKKTIIREEK